MVTFWPCGTFYALPRGPGTDVLDWVSLRGFGHHVSPLALCCGALGQPLL